MHYLPTPMGSIVSISDWIGDVDLFCWTFYVVRQPISNHPSFLLFSDMCLHWFVDLKVNRLTKANALKRDVFYLHTNFGLPPLSMLSFGIDTSQEKRLIWCPSFLLNIWSQHPFNVHECHLLIHPCIFLANEQMSKKKLGIHIEQSFCLAYF